MFWEVLLSIGTVLITVFFWVWKDNKNFPDGNNGQHPKIQKRLLNFADFFKYLTHEKTATHIGSPEMKTLSGMLCHQTLDEISPAVLRGWSRAIRDRAGTFSKIKIETAQLQENVRSLSSSDDQKEQKQEPIFNEFCQMIAEIEFEPLEKKDHFDFRSSGSSLSSMAPSPNESPKNSSTATKKTSVSDAKEENEEEKNKTTKKNSSAVVTCPCLIRFRTDPRERNSSNKDTNNTQNNDDDDNKNLPTAPIRESIVGFHVLPPKNLTDENGKQLPFDIMSFIDPFEIDQFVENAVETLFDKKHSNDPFDGFWKFCVKPLQQLYDLKKEETKKEEIEQKPVVAATSSLVGLPPKQRREKLKNDMKKLKSDMGYIDAETERTYSVSTTMNNAEIDEKTYPNAKSICARVTHTGPDRDCIVTLHVLLDADSPFGLGIVKYSFGMTAPKKKTMLFDQDTQNPLGTF